MAERASESVDRNCAIFDRSGRLVVTQEIVVELRRQSLMNNNTLICHKRSYSRLAIKLVFITIKETV